MGVSPCGAIVDVARTTRVVTVRPWQGSAITTRIRYYFVADGTAQVPFVNHWAHPCWDDAGITYNQGLGYVQTDEPIVPNRPPAARYLPDHFCGAQRLWEEGQILDLDEPLPQLGGHTICCLPGDLFPEGGAAAAAAGGDGTDNFIPGIEPGAVAGAVAGGEGTDLVVYTETGEAFAVGGGDARDTRTWAEGGAAEAAAGGDGADLVVMAEGGAAEAVAGGDGADAFESGGGGITTACSGSYVMPATLYWNTADCCGGFADEPMVWTPGGWSGTDAWLTTPISCSGSMVHFGFRCTMSGWQVGQFVDDVLVGTGTVSSESYSPFLASGIGAFSAPSCSFTASFVISEEI